jgi:hypothetical protein
MAQNKCLFDTFFMYYMFLVPIHYCLYYFFVIVDTLVILFVLRSNRAVFQNVYRNVKRCLKRSLRRRTSVVHANQPTRFRATSIVSQMAKFWTYFVYVKIYKWTCCRRASRILEVTWTYNTPYIGTTGGTFFKTNSASENLDWKFCCLLKLKDVFGSD